MVPSLGMDLAGSTDVRIKNNENKKFYGEKFHFVKDWEGWSTVGLVSLLYLYMYYGFVWLIILPVLQEYPILTKCVLFQFHVTFAMTLCCWLQAMLRHPGSPSYEVINSMPSG